MTTENTEVLQDFADIIEDLENARKRAFDKNEHNIGHKISGVIQAFKAFTEEEIITMDSFLND
jgi:predicted secreted Zn-dependent protease